MLPLCRSKVLQRAPTGAILLICIRSLITVDQIANQPQNKYSLHYALPIARDFHSMANIVKFAAFCVSGCNKPTYNRPNRTFSGVTALSIQYYLPECQARCAFHSPQCFLFVLSKSDKWISEFLIFLVTRCLIRVKVVWHSAKYFTKGVGSVWNLKWK